MPIRTYTISLKASKPRKELKEKIVKAAAGITEMMNAYSIKLVSSPEPMIIPRIDVAVLDLRLFNLTFPRRIAWHLALPKMFCLGFRLCG